jgi:hypothetical protein
MVIPCVVYITAAVLTPELSALWKQNMKGSNCTYRYFDDARVLQSASQLGIRRYVDAVRPWAFKVDLWRYAQALKSGGIFFDAELQLYKPPEQIFDLETDVLQVPRDRSPRCLFNAIMAAPARSPAVRRVLIRAISNVRKKTYGHEDSAKEPWLGITGPCTMAAALRKDLGFSDDVRIIGSYPSPAALDLNGNRIALSNDAVKRTIITNAGHYGTFWGQHTVYA